LNQENKKSKREARVRLAPPFSPGGTSCRHRLTQLAATYCRHGLTNRTFGRITRVDQRAIVEDRWLSRPSGQKVKNRRQAVAIALSEAGASNQQTPKENKEHLRRTKAKERRGETA
jgi:hypothetical protein